MSKSIFLSLDTKKKILIPLYEDTVAAGFPSPAEDYIEKKLDLNDLLIKHPAATFFVRVQGSSMQDASILSGDMLVVDRSLPAKNGSIVIAIYNGEFTVKRLKIEGENIFLIPENKTFKAIEIKKSDEFEIWGVVSYVIHKAC
jgi:DNA polymerase V